MKRIKCFDVVQEVVNEANKRFAPTLKLNKEKFDILNQYCSVIDDLGKEFNGLSYDIEIDEISTEISIAIECESELIIEESSHVFYELAKRTVRLGFNASEDGNLLITFVFPTIWEK